LKKSRLNGSYPAVCDAKKSLMAVLIHLAGGLSKRRSWVDLTRYPMMCHELVWREPSVCGSLETVIGRLFMNLIFKLPAKETAPSAEQA
jgi:hypothetical protein